MMGVEALARVALYWAPAVDDPLHRLGSAWLGRDAETGASIAQPSIPGLDLPALTADPRRYGLHATLKPPFHLTGSYAALRADAAALAAAVGGLLADPARRAELGARARARAAADLGADLMAERTYRVLAGVASPPGTGAG